MPPRAPGVLRSGAVQTCRTPREDAVIEENAGCPRGVLSRELSILEHGTRTKSNANLKGNAPAPRRGQHPFTRPPPPPLLNETQLRASGYYCGVKGLRAAQSRGGMAVWMSIHRRVTGSRGDRRGRERPASGAAEAPRRRSDLARRAQPDPPPTSSGSSTECPSRRHPMTRPAIPLRRSARRD